MSCPNRTSWRAARSLLLALPLAAAGWLSLPAPVADAALKCGGMRATIVGPAKGGVIRATKKHQVIVARGPRNVIHTKGGNNRICGGPGKDRIHAGEGPDRIWGRGGDDVIFGGRGPDRIWGGGGNDRIVGGRGVNRIWGGGGDDTIRGGVGSEWIWGGPGNDVLRGGGGRDRIRGGGGHDFIDGGPGGDSLWGGSGDDLILGRDGADRIWGGAGNDRLYGGQVDDFIWGDDGDDVISGGHGVDHMYGGAGNDLMRGDLNRNVFDGGPGTDTASWSTTTPGAWGGGPTAGVKVDLSKGQATADGTDRLRGIQRVLGSSFSDDLSGMAGSSVDGGLGDNDCVGFDSEVNCDGTLPRPYLHVDVRDPRDPGLILVGGSEPDRWQVSAAGGSVAVSHQTDLDYRISTSEPSPCASPGPGTIRCDFTPRFVVAWGGGGNDSIEVGGALPPEATVIIDGGQGDDTLIGGPADDILIDRGGRKTMLGNGGADALISGPGRDILRGGPGNDQLVTSTPCDGHLFDGGPGELDIAGFRRSPFAVHVQRGGYARPIKPRAGCSPTRVLMNNPVIEGTQFNDVLVGTKRADFLIAGPGNDRLIGRGGMDHFNAGPGRDTCLGGRKVVSWNGCKVRRYKFK